MINLIKRINHKLNGVIINFVLVGFFFLAFSILVAIDSSLLALRVVISSVVLALSYAFFYGAYKVWSIKKEIDQFGKHITHNM